MQMFVLCKHPNIITADLSKWYSNLLEFDPCQPIRSHYPNSPDPLTSRKSVAGFAITPSSCRSISFWLWMQFLIADKIRFLVTYCYSSIIPVNKWISVSRLLATTQEHKFLMQNWSTSDSLWRINHGRSIQCNMPLARWFRCVFYQTHELSSEARVPSVGI